MCAARHSEHGAGTGLLAPHAAYGPAHCVGGGGVARRRRAPASQRIAMGRSASSVSGGLTADARRVRAMQKRKCTFSGAMLSDAGWRVGAACGRPPSVASSGSINRNGEIVLDERFPTSPEKGSKRKALFRKLQLAQSSLRQAKTASGTYCTIVVEPSAATDSGRGGPHPQW
eukprot:949970-Alexandrium_andersonii.AAC.1